MGASHVRWVRLFRQARLAPGGSVRQLETRFVVIDNPYESGILASRETLGVYEVQGCRSKEAALGAVAEWLANGRPSWMTVQELKARVSA